MLNNKYNNLVNYFNKKNIIKHYQNRNNTNFSLLIQERNKVISYFRLEQKIKSININIFNINFLY